MKETKELTILDRCRAIGEAFYIGNFADALEQTVKAIVINFGSDDFDRVAFLADVGNSLDYCDGIIAAATDIKKTLEAMRSEVSPIFISNQEQEE